MKIEKIKIDDRILHDFFKTEFFIDTKLTRLCFNLNMFTCSILLRERNIGTLDLNNNKFYDGGDGTLNFIYRVLTVRQYGILRKQIKKAYKQILKIKYEEFFENDFLLNDEQIKKYEKYREKIDRI